MTMKAVLGLAALLGVAVAEPIREKRQTSCTETFQNVPDVCRNNPTAQLFFPHPTDPTKFLQCDVVGRMYIVQCPAGEVFVMQYSGCQPKSGVTTQPITHPPLATTHQVITGSNPCTREATARGQLYFAYPNDATRFYECDLEGHANVLQCPHGLVWDQRVLSCVYPVEAIKPSQGNPTQSPSALGITGSNPCTAQAIAAGIFFFPHPDHTKFIQCDQWGEAFVISCPNNYFWHATFETCYNPSVQVVVGKK